MGKRAPSMSMAGVKPVVAAAKPAPAVAEPVIKTTRVPAVLQGVPNTPIDDLDEETSVIDGKRPSKASAARKQAASDAGVVIKAREAPKEPPVTRAPMVRKGTMQQVDEGFESMLASSEAAALASAPAPVLAAPAPAVAAPIAEPAPVVEAAVAPVVEAAVAPAPAPIAAPPPSGLLAQRVAVVAGLDGEVRLVPLDGLASLPKGAIAAIVVPLAAGDGAPLARLLSAKVR